MLGQFLQTLLPKLGVLVLVAFLDLVGGVVVALRSGSFQWEKLPEFLKSFVMYLYAWLTAEAIWFVLGSIGVDLEGLWGLFEDYSGSAVFAGVLIKYGSSIVGHLQVILGRSSQTLAKLGLPATK